MSETTLDDLSEHQRFWPQDERIRQLHHDGYTKGIWKPDIATPEELQHYIDRAVMFWGAEAVRHAVPANTCDDLDALIERIVRRGDKQPFKCVNGILEWREGIK